MRHAVVHDACVPELAHTSVDYRIAGQTLAPGGKVFFCCGSRGSCRIASAAARQACAESDKAGGEKIRARRFHASKKSRPRLACLPA